MPMAAGHIRPNDPDIDMATAMRLVTQSMREAETRYEQRFMAQERAVETALLSLQRETGANLNAMKERFTSQESLQIERVAQLRRETDEVRDQAAKQFQALADLKANELLQVERMESLRREAEALRKAQDTAIQKSDIATEKRFESVNEFREQLRDQASGFMNRAEAETRDASTTEKVDDLKSRIVAMESTQLGARQQGTDSRAVIASVIGVMLFVLTLGGVLAAVRP